MQSSYFYQFGNFSESVVFAGEVLVLGETYSPVFGMVFEISLSLNPLRGIFIENSQQTLLIF